MPGVQWIAYNFWREIAVADGALKEMMEAMGIQSPMTQRLQLRNRMRKGKMVKRGWIPRCYTWSVGQSGWPILLITDHN